MKLSPSVKRWALLIAAVTAYSKVFDEASNLIEGKFGDTPIAGLIAIAVFLGLFCFACFLGMLIEETTGTQLT